MQAITKQVEALVEYKGDTFDALNAEYDAFRERIEEGLEKMKEISVFSDSEINHVKNFAFDLIASRLRTAKEVLRQNLRDSFQF